MPAGLEAVLAVDGFQARLELAGEPRHAADDADGGGVEVGALAPPLLEDVVDGVAFGHDPDSTEVPSQRVAS